MDDRRVRLIALATIFLACFAAVLVVSPNRRPQRRLPNWDLVPYTIDGWSGAEAKFDPIYGTDPAESSLLRIYRRGEEVPVILYVGYFGDLSTILDVHTPELCYPAQGWSIIGSRISPPVTFRGKPIQSKQIVADKLGNRRLVVWWYNAGARPIGTQLRHVFAMLAMSTLTGRSDGSMVRLETPVDGGGEAAAEARIVEFRRSVLPELEKTLPL